MNDKITGFLAQQLCATVCSINEDKQPYCFSCFYAFNKEEGLLYYKSSANTQHSANIMMNPVVAGSILPDKLSRFLVQGIQFEGIVLARDHPSASSATFNYYKKHPGAVAVHGEVWTIRLDSIKFTDSSLGFGKKILWSRAEAIAENP